MIVAATGNEGVATVSYPAAMTHVVAVGALAHNAERKPHEGVLLQLRQRARHLGSRLVDLGPDASPGTSTPTRNEWIGRGPGYRWWDGTSMAAPVVAGGIAWLWRAAPWMTNSQIVLLVENTAHDMGAPGRDSTYGHGALDIEAAYQELIKTYPLLKTPTITPLSEDNARNIRVKWAPVSGYGVRIRRLGRRRRAPEQYVGDEREASVQHHGRRARHQGHRQEPAKLDR